jgi:hypothetical protein
MNVSNQFGNLSPETFENKKNKIKSVLAKSSTSAKKLAKQNTSLIEINNNISESYNVSLKIIVDVTKLLNQYMIYFNEIEKLISSFSNETSNSLNNDYFLHINKITSEKIDELSNNFKTQVDSLKEVYIKNDLPTGDLDKYSDLLSVINIESKNIIKAQKGGSFKKKKNK